jgi:hypothetical protein
VAISWLAVNSEDAELGAFPCISLVDDFFGGVVTGQIIKIIQAAIAKLPFHNSVIAEMNTIAANGGNIWVGARLLASQELDASDMLDLYQSVTSGAQPMPVYDDSNTHVIALDFMTSDATSTSMVRYYFHQPVAVSSTARVSNLSVRGAVGAGANAIIGGFVVGPGFGSTVLIRAVGPGLTQFSVSGVLSHPLLQLFDSKTQLITSNSKWNALDAATMASVGAFALPANSLDADIVAVLTPGNYTAVISGAAGETGIALLEIYEVRPTINSSRLTNLSGRAVVGTGASALQIGITIANDGSRSLLMRASGPALSQFISQSTLLSNPYLKLFDATGNLFAQNDDWGVPLGSGASSAAALSTAFTQAGAFAFPAGSKDSALIAILPSGTYIATVTGSESGPTGLSLFELYDITSP